MICSYIIEPPVNRSCGDPAIAIIGSSGADAAFPRCLGHVGPTVIAIVRHGWSFTIRVLFPEPAPSFEDVSAATDRIGEIVNDAYHDAEHIDVRSAYPSKLIMNALYGKAMQDGGRIHPHDGYAYDGCNCVCCLNVRALGVTGDPIANMEASRSDHFANHERGFTPRDLAHRVGMTDAEFEASRGDHFAYADKAASEAPAPASEPVTGAGDGDQL